MNTFSKVLNIHNFQLYFLCNLQDQKREVNIIETPSLQSLNTKTIKKSKTKKKFSTLHEDSTSVEENTKQTSRAKYMRDARRVLTQNDYEVAKVFIYYILICLALCSVFFGANCSGQFRQVINKTNRLLCCAKVSNICDWNKSV